MSAVKAAQRIKAKATARRKGHDYAVVSSDAVVSTHTSIWAAKAAAVAVVGTDVAAVNSVIRVWHRGKWVRPAQHPDYAKSVKF